jgi:hypothetical protein
MRILAYIMISTNRIFESAHGPEYQISLRLSQAYIQ